MSERIIDVAISLSEEQENDLIKFFIERGWLEETHTPEDFDEVFNAWVQEDIELDILNLYR